MNVASGCCRIATDPEPKASLRGLLGLKPVALLADHVWDVDGGERIGGGDDETSVRGEASQRPAGVKHRERAFQARQVEIDGGRLVGHRML